MNITGKTFADTIGWAVERKDLRLVARIVYDYLLDNAESMLENGIDEMRMKLLATTSNKAGAGDIVGIGMTEFLECFFAAKKVFDENEKNQKLVWYFAPLFDGKKQKDENEAGYAYEVCIALTDDDSAFVNIGFSKPTKTHQKRASGAQEAKNREAKKEKAEKEKAEKEKEEEEKKKEQAIANEQARLNMQARIHSIAVKCGLTNPQGLANFDKEIETYLREILK